MDPEKMAALMGEDLAEGAGMAEMDEAYNAMLPMLEAAAEELNGCCEGIDEEVLLDPSMELAADEVDAITVGFGELPEDLQGALFDFAAEDGIAMEETFAMADHLANEGLTENPDRLGGWLYRVGQLILSGEIEMEEVDDEEDEEEDEAEDMEDEAMDDFEEAEEEFPA